MLAHRLRLRRTKVKEMEMRPFRTLVMQTSYKEVAGYFSCFWRTKSSLVGRIDLGGYRDTHRKKRANGSLKIKNDHNGFELGPKRRSHCPDRGAANGSPIQARMRENEPVKVFVKVGLWARFKCPTI